ncbi:MAG: PKD domain-containing protein [Bacteroidales bacterium]
MKTKKEDKILRGLFRKKLENFEIIPDPSVKSDLMRRTGGVEFLRFNPGRFNIWYTGGILAAAFLIVLLLSLRQGRKNTVIQPEISHDSIDIVMPDEPALSRVQESDKSIPARPDITKPASGNAREKAGGNKVQPIGRGIQREGAGGLKTEESILEQSVGSGCTPLKVSFSIKSGSFDSCYWTFGDGGFSKMKEPVWIFDNYGEYKVNLKIFNTDGSQKTASSVITVFPRPLVHFEFPPGNPGIPDEEISFINSSNGAEKFRWDFGDGNASESFEPHHRYQKSGVYNVRLIAYSEHGCVDTLTVNDVFGRLGYFIKFPDSFIPNPGGPPGGHYSPGSDETAHIFHPVDSGISDYRLRIFNGRGTQIFESNDIYFGWDGYFNGQICEPGVYAWKVRGKYLNGEPFTKMGDVTLIKTGR